MHGVVTGVSSSLHSGLVLAYSTMTVNTNFFVKKVVFSHWCCEYCMDWPAIMITCRMRKMCNYKHKKPHDIISLYSMYNYS